MSSSRTGWAWCPSSAGGATTTSTTSSARTRCAADASRGAQTTGAEEGTEESPSVSRSFRLSPGEQVLPSQLWTAFASHAQAELQRQANPAATALRPRVVPEVSRNAVRLSSAHLQRCAGAGVQLNACEAVCLSMGKQRMRPMHQSPGTVAWACAGGWRRRGRVQGLRGDRVLAAPHLHDGHHRGDHHERPDPRRALPRRPACQCAPGIPKLCALQARAPAASC